MRCRNYGAVVSAVIRRREPLDALVAKARRTASAVCFRHHGNPNAYENEAGQCICNCFAFHQRVLTSRLL